MGPLTLLLLGKNVGDFDSMTLLPKLIAAYGEMLQLLAAERISWVQIDEPFLVTDLEEPVADAYAKTYRGFEKIPIKLMLTTYFGSLADNLTLAAKPGMAGIHIDAVRGADQVKAVASALNPEQVLSIGCVDGRNIWLSDFAVISSMLKEATGQLGLERVVVAPSWSGHIISIGQSRHSGSLRVPQKMERRFISICATATSKISCLPSLP
ncbi:cobalamin-independent synthase [Edaphobacter modestus]|uniref:Cobalamin-independent synthase n=1 Tax=Edaphobacter modestus TaxID=388466 RepID=A0A4Q7YYS1_9BACT|nr:cobalamin-independent synthase [Edaphobacter modestus]